MASWITPKKWGAATTLLGMLAANVASADGVTAYLPVQLEPEVERQIERVMILAEEPILKRPFAVNLVELALPKACERDRVLCEKVRLYLERYSKDYAITHASITASYAHGGNGVVPNSHGLPLQSHWDASATGFVQPNDYMLASVGAVAYKGRLNPVGTYVSVGAHGMQLDLGYRDHWNSPMTDSSMLLGTESLTTPSATLSNYEPLTRLGFQYELFWTQLSESSHILGQGQGTTLQSRGVPKLFGAQFSIEPFSGWSIGLNRMLEYGGGGLPDSAGTLFRNFFKPSGKAQTQGNQQASYITRMVFPYRVPFAVYGQYAGEDNSNGGSYLLGNTSTSVGIDFPRLGRYFDLTYEVSEWQNFWYTNSVFLDGMVNDGLVLGHWGGDQRTFNDGVGARSQMLRVGWEPPFGGYLEGRVRTLENASYSPYAYKHYFDTMVRYTHPWNELTLGGEVVAGRDVFGKAFTRVSGFVRYGGESRTRDESADDEDDSGDTPQDEDIHGTEVFVDVGANGNQVRTDLQKGLPLTKSRWSVGPHVGLGVRRAVGEFNDLGLRAEFDTRVDGHNLLGVRFLDYRHRFGDHVAFGLGVGVARYDLATPAYSLYGTTGMQWRNVIPKWDLSADFRFAQNVARDHVLPTDPAGVRADSFYKIQSVLFYLSRKF